jgi:hypothetical protein
MRRPTGGSNERGIAMVWAAVFLTAFFGMAAVAVDLSYMYLTKGELQDAADAASLAAAAALREGQSRDQAAAAAVAMADNNHAGGKTVQLDAGADVTFGDYDNGVFQQGGVTGASAVRVTARRTKTAPAGPIQLLFARIWGHDETDIVAGSVAALGKRDVVIVQDITWSFLQEIGDAKNADKALVNAMAASGLSGDRVGVVTFNEASQQVLGFRDLPAQKQTVLTAIDGIRSCQTTSQPNCAGTHIAPGFNTATNLFRTSANAGSERVIILVSDGMPYPSNRRQPAINAANAADQQGISIFTVTLTQESSGSYGSGGADAAFNAGLVRGFGKAYQTADSKKLDEILLQILKEMPMHLVQ